MRLEVEIRTDSLVRIATLVLPDGAHIAVAQIMAPLPEALSADITRQIAGLDPWKRYGFSPEALARFLVPAEPSAPRFLLVDGNAFVGLFALKLGWLLGSYLNLIAILPGHQGRGIASAVLDWMEREGRARGERNQFVATSAFNDGGLRLYRRHGFAPVAELPGLISDDETEILLRRRLA